MPRIQNPFLGEDGYDDFSIRDLKRIALRRGMVTNALSTLPIKVSPKQERDARATLKSLHRRYWRIKDRAEQAFTKGEAGAALDWFINNPVQGYHEFASLNERARQLLLDQLWMMKLPLVERTPSVMSALIDGRVSNSTLLEAARNARTQLSSLKGIEPKVALEWLIPELCFLFENLTSKKATHSQKGKLLAHDPAPRSPAGRFVREAVRAIDRTISDRNVSTVLRKAKSAEFARGTFSAEH